MSSEGMRIDHVIYGVRDVDAAAERLRAEHGLGSLPGGIHLGGTTNRVVPLAPPTFLELLGVGDPTLPDGAWLSMALADGERMLWWALTVADLDDAARRRGLPIQSGTMEMADGSTSSFRTVGMHRYPLPFLISYEIGIDARIRLWEDRAREAGHTCEPGAITHVEVGEPAPLLDAWLGDHGLPIRSVAGRPGIHAVGIAGADGDVIVIR